MSMPAMVATPDTTRNSESTSSGVGPRLASLLPLVAEAPRDSERERDRSRNARQHLVPARTIPLREVAALVALEGATEPPGWRPRTRAECAGVPRPCPFVSCKWNLYLEPNEAGGLKLRFPWREPSDMPETGSCALDVADRGGATLAEVAELLNVSREAVRLIEAEAFRSVAGSRRHLPVLRELVEE